MHTQLAGILARPNTPASILFSGVTELTGPLGSCDPVVPGAYKPPKAAIIYDTNPMSSRGRNNML